MDAPLLPSTATPMTRSTCWDSDHSPSTHGVNDAMDQLRTVKSALVKDLIGNASKAASLTGLDVQTRLSPSPPNPHETELSSRVSSVAKSLCHFRSSVSFSSE